MSKERTTISLTKQQKKRLEKRSQEEHLPMSEIIRRLDVYLAWDDPTYAPYAQASQKVGQFIPWINRRGFPGQVQ